MRIKHFHILIEPRSNYECRVSRLFRLIWVLVWMVETRHWRKMTLSSLVTNCFHSRAEQSSLYRKASRRRTMHSGLRLDEIDAFYS